MNVKLVLVEGDNEFDYDWEAGRTLAKSILSYLKEKLAEHGKSFEDLTGIGVNAGPGSYTGLRIGITVLNTLAESLRIPIVGASGDDWQVVCLRRLSEGETDSIVIPQYGGDAHITKPRK